MAGLSYTNGTAPDSALVFIDGIHMVPSIAPRVNDFIAYAATQGRTLRIAHKYGGYRNLAEQKAVGENSNPASTVPVALAGSSTHGVYDRGRVDFVGADGVSYNADLLAWIVANAGAFGLVREFPGPPPKLFDPNHFMASGDYTPKNPTVQEEEDDMTDYLLKYTVAGTKPLPAGFPIGSYLKGSGNSPLVWLSNPGPETDLQKLTVAEWDGQAISDRISQVGMLGSGKDLAMVFATMADAFAGTNPVYTLGGNVVGGSIDTSGLATKADIADYATATSTDVAAVGKKVDAIKVPTTFVAQP